MNDKNWVIDVLNDLSIFMELNDESECALAIENAASKCAKIVEETNKELKKPWLVKIDGGRSMSGSS